MLERSDSAKIGLSAFFYNYNDIDIFIEDTAFGYSKIFANLVSRAISQNISIDRIFPLGGRDNVLSHARRVIEEKSERPALFVVDGDLYLLCGEYEELPENTLVLPRYCIENFLIDENAIIELADEESPSLDIEQIMQQMEISNWIESTRENLQYMFILFAAAHKLKLGVKTVARGYKSICQDEHGSIDATKITNIIKEIEGNLYNAHPQHVVDEIIENIRSSISAESCFLKKYVSAKDFTLPLVLLKLRHITKTKSTTINLKLRLAKKANVNELTTIAEKIHSTLKG